jgi:hypothetical protein
MTQHLKNGGSQAELATESGISLRCAYRWLVRHRSDDAASLAGRRGVRKWQPIVAIMERHCNSELRFHRSIGHVRAGSASVVRNISFLLGKAALLAFNLFAPADPAYAEANNALIPGIEEMKAGYLEVVGIRNLRFNEQCAQVQESSILSFLVPKLTVFAVESFSKALVSASGFDHQKRYIEGKLNTTFYCRQPVDKFTVDGMPVKDASGKVVRIHAHHQKLEGFKITSRKNSEAETDPSKPFEAEIAIDISPDGQAFRYRVRSVSYPVPVLNNRAYGAVLALTTNALDGGTTAIIPLANSPCGRPGSQAACTPSDSAKKRWESDWIPLPAVNKEETILGSATNLNSTPVTIKAQLWEVSNYNKFLKWVGDFIGANKDDISALINDLIPPYTQELRDARYAEQAGSAISLANYLGAQAEYIAKSRDGSARCTEVVLAWSKMVQASITARVVADLQPPSCLKEKPTP